MDALVSLSAIRLRVSQVKHIHGIHTNNNTLLNSRLFELAPRLNPIAAFAIAKSVSLSATITSTAQIDFRRPNVHSVVIFQFLLDFRDRNETL